MRSRNSSRSLSLFFFVSLRVFVFFVLIPPSSGAQILDLQKQLDRQTFWDNRDWDWYKANIPFFESPDAELDTTYYYRWELVTKHMVYGSPESGYVYTEFMDRPFWSGRYGAISCAAGHHLYEVRWLADPRYAQDYARYWFQTEGAQARRYSCWIADAVWATHLAQNDPAFAKSLLAGMVKNYEGWEREHFNPDVGLFWQSGHDDGMEYNINSRQSPDIVKGAPGYRPTLNAYMFADALAIAETATLAGDAELAKRFASKAAALKENVQKKLWDPTRHFFFHMYKEDESRDGFTCKALTLTEQTGKFANSGFGREEIGFVPWQFDMPDAGFESAWQFLTDPKRFQAKFGPTTVERDDPMFHLASSCCWWSGQSWPYATTQTLMAMANLLNHYDQKFVTKADYVALLHTFAISHRRDGKPYLAEALNPDTDSFKGHDSYNHSEHYFHSAFCDLVITGLAGLHPRADDTLEVQPLAPEEWGYFALDQVPYHGHRVAILWDKTGERYGKGKGLTILVDGQVATNSPTMTKVTCSLSATTSEISNLKSRINYAVNNDGTYYPRASATFTASGTSPAKAIDGQAWYTARPPNRWTTEGSPNATDAFEIDFGVARPIDTIKLYPLDDGQGSAIRVPAKIDLEFFDGSAWKPIFHATRTPTQPEGHRANVITFPTIQATKLRATFTHAQRARTGLSEFEAWGAGPLPVPPAPPPAGLLSLNTTGKGFPKASASFTSKFDKVEEANDGKIVYTPELRNRWTAYESPHDTDWVAIDLGAEHTVSRVELHLFDDHGGVQAPKSYAVQYRGGDQWKDVEQPKKIPEQPAGGRVNTVTFTPVRTAQIRVVFVHNSPARSGLTEIEVWEH